MAIIDSKVLADFCEAVEDLPEKKVSAIFNMVKELSMSLRISDLRIDSILKENEALKANKDDKDVFTPEDLGDFEETDEIEG